MREASDVLSGQSTETCSGGQWARVVSVESRHALVRVELGCGRCHEPGGCGGVAFPRIFSRAASCYRVRNSCGARPGDRVRVVMPADCLNRHAMLAYGLPLTGLLLGALIGETAIGGDSAALAGGGLGLFLAWLLMRVQIKHTGNFGDEPDIVQIDS